MTKYVELNAVLDAMGNQQDGTGMTFEALNHAMRDVMSLPQVETVPVKKGEWLPMYCSSVFGGSASAWGSSIAGYMCSECDEEISIDDDYAYCPYCGSRNVKKDD